MENLGEPFIPIHPGEIIKEELEFRKISPETICPNCRFFVHHA